MVFVQLFCVYWYILLILLKTSNIRFNLDLSFALILFLFISLAGTEKTEETNGQWKYLIDLVQMAWVLLGLRLFSCFSFFFKYNLKIGLVWVAKDFHKIDMEKKINNNNRYCNPTVAIYSFVMICFFLPLALASEARQLLDFFRPSCSCCPCQNN